MWLHNEFFNLRASDNKGEKTRRKRKNISFLLPLLSRMAAAFDACDNTVWLMRKVHGTLIKLWVLVCACVRVREGVSAARERKLIKILCLSKAKLVRRMMPRPAATRNLNTFIAAPHLYTCIAVCSWWKSFKNPKTARPHLRQTWSLPRNRNILMLMPGALRSHSAPYRHLCFLSVNLEWIHI